MADFRRSTASLALDNGVHCANPDEITGLAVDAVGWADTAYAGIRSSQPGPVSTGGSASRFHTVLVRFFGFVTPFHTGLPLRYRLPMQESGCHSPDLYPLTVPPPYDGAPIYRTVAQYGADIEVIIPPRLGAVASTEMGPLKQRDRYVEMLQR